MEERDLELPVATLRPRRFVARLASLRGAFSRWLRDRVHHALHGRHAPLLLTSIVFSGMMLAMGYVADRASQAAAAIDQMHRAHRQWMYQDRATAVDIEVATTEARDATVDPWAAAETRPRPTVLFYVRSSN